jgi:hypothetical protein
LLVELGVGDPLLNPLGVLVGFVLGLAFWDVIFGDGTDGGNADVEVVGVLLEYGEW